MHEQPAPVNDPGDRIVAVREDDRAEAERAGDVQADERDSRPAGDERPLARGMDGERDQLGEHQQQARGDQSGARPEKRGTVEGEPRRDEETPRQQRQGDLEPSRMPDVVAKHHREQVERGAGDGGRQQPERDEVRSEHRGGCERLSRCEVGSGDEHCDRSGGPARQREREVGGEEAERDRAPDGSSVSQRQRLRAGASA